MQKNDIFNDVISMYLLKISDKQSNLMVICKGGIDKCNEF